MPSPLLAPNPLNDTTAGVPWAPSYTGSRTTTRTVGPGSVDDQKWAEYIATLTEQLRLTSGLQRRQIERQIQDAQDAHKNALELQQLQDKTSRYGTDVASRDRIAALQQADRQFNATHGLEMERLGLDRAKTATDLMASPDRYVEASRFLNLSGRILANQGGPAPYGAAGSEQPNTLNDFAVLQAGGTPGRQIDGAQAGAGTGAGADARVKALKAVIEASPPSPGDGLDNNAFHVLNAAKSIYSLNLNPQQQAAIKSSPEYQSMLGSSIRNLGGNPNEWMTRQRASLPGQGSVRSA